MIDDIVEMILKEARATDRQNMFKSTYVVMQEVMERCNWIAAYHVVEQRRREENENRNRNQKKAR